MELPPPLLCNQMMDHFPISRMKREKAISVYEVVEGAHWWKRLRGSIAAFDAMNMDRIPCYYELHIHRAFLLYFYIYGMRKERITKDNWLIKVPLFHSVSSSEIESFTG
jgi:hypothetical protein